MSKPIKNKNGISPETFLGFAVEKEICKPTTPWLTNFLQIF